MSWRDKELDMSIFNFDDVLATTDAAVLFSFDGGAREEWVPRYTQSGKELIAGGGEDLEREQGPGEIEIADWIAEKKGLF